MGNILITNNPMAFEMYESKQEVIFLEQKSSVDVLLKTRDYIHLGHKLITNPVAGNILPNETPYKSLLVSKEKNTANTISIMVIEESIRNFKSMLGNRMKRSYDDIVLKDLQLIDLELIDE